LLLFFLLVFYDMQVPVLVGNYRFNVLTYYIFLPLLELGSSTYFQQHPDPMYRNGSYIDRKLYLCK
jgi:hypothetical protein